jgi:hypothetical protein
VSLELECSYIVRALKMYSRLSPRLQTPFAHSLLGMTTTKLTAIARDEGESQRLAVYARVVVEVGWTIFPCVSSGIVEPLQ